MVSPLTAGSYFTQTRTMDHCSEVIFVAGLASKATQVGLVRERVPLRFPFGDANSPQSFIG